MIETPHSHLSDEDLVLHYYGELGAREETAAARHLGTCAACRTEYTRLQRVLGAVDEISIGTPELPSSFERTVWARLEPNLPGGGSAWRSWLRMSPASLALAAMVIALVTGAFFAGRSFGPAAPPAGDGPAAASAQQIRERILLVDLGDHLDRSQMVLVELVNSDDTGSVDISAERGRAEQLVADNRLYRQAAEQNGDAAVTELLDDIERVLTEVAASPEHVSAQDLEGVRRRIESRDLLFKVRIISSKVRQRQKEPIARNTNQMS